MILGIIPWFCCLLLIYLLWKPFFDDLRYFAKHPNVDDDWKLIYEEHIREGE